MDQILPIIIALIAIFVVWKVLKGIIKAGALVLIICAVAWFWFGGMA